MTEEIHSGMEQERALCAARLTQLLAETSDISGAVVATLDGFEIASRVHGDISPRKLAAMSSALLSLADAVSKEGRVGACRDMVIDSSEGRVFLMDIPWSKNKLLLMVLCGNVAMLGKVLWAVRNTRECIAKDLEAHHSVKAPLQIS